MLDTCVAILVLVLIGFLGTRRGLLSEDFSKKASWLVMNVFLPASIFNSIADGIGQLSVRQLPHILLMMTLFVAVSYVFSCLFTLAFGRRAEDPALLELSISAMNTLLVGLPILQGVYGSMAVLYTGMSNLPFNFCLYTYGVWRLSSTGPERVGGIRLRSMFTLCLGATVLGLVFFCFGIPVPGGHLYLCDAVICLAALLLNPFEAFIVGGVGSFLGDMLFYPTPMFVSLVTHGLQAVVISLIAHKTLKNHPKLASGIAVTVGAVIMVVGYTLGKTFVYSTFEYAMIKLPYEIAQALLGVAGSLLLCYRFGLKNIFKKMELI